MLIDFNENIL